jgi:hypothetical protein
MQAPFHRKREARFTSNVTQNMERMDLQVGDSGQTGQCPVFLNIGKQRYVPSLFIEGFPPDFLAWHTFCILIHLENLGAK